MFCVAGAATAGVDKKVALVIGNSNYVHTVVLPNPARDGQLMAATLRNAGFQVIDGFDLDKAHMTSLIDQFTEAAYDADIALIYYAGHGLQVDGQNYLIPVDVKLERAAQLQTRTVTVEDLMRALPPDPAVSMILLDACRDNPLSRSLAAALPATRSMGSGLAAIQTNVKSTGSGGLLIAYATDPGSVAFDGKGANSPYTTALAKYLAEPGVEVQTALTRVRADVSEVTKGAQRPWVSSSLGREVYLGGAPNKEPALMLGSQPSDATTAKAADPAGDVEWSVEQRIWDEASKRNTVEHYELYLQQFPAGRFVGIARLNIDQLKQTESTAKANGTAPAAKTVDVAIAEPSSQVRTAVSIPENVRTVAGTSFTEEALGLDRDKRVDLQMRLSALGHETGGYDGSLGPRSRAAIGAWQRQTGIVETTYLTPEQYGFLVLQTDPMMPGLRARVEAENRKAAEQRRVAQAQVQKRQVAAQRVKQRSQTQRVRQPREERRYIDEGGGGGSVFNDPAAGAFVGGLLGGAIGSALKH